MRLTTKLSAFITFLSLLAMSLMLAGCAFSFFWFSHQRVEHRAQILAVQVDQAMLTQTPDQLHTWLTSIMPIMNAEQILLHNGRQTLLTLSRHENPMLEDEPNRFIQFEVPLMHQTGLQLRVVTLDPAKTWLRSITGTSTLGILFTIILVMSLMLLMMHRWLSRQWRGMEHLEVRAEAIINGERGVMPKRGVDEWPPRASRALDLLLVDVQEAAEQRVRIDTLIRTFAAQDGRTGLNNRLFFDNQLATLLEDQEDVGTHGVVMMVRLPDLDTLQETLEPALVDEYLFNFVNMLSTFVLRYPGALLARYFRSDFAVLLPHRSLKEANSIADQLINAVDSLPPMRQVNRDDLIHIGISAWHSGQTVPQVMENAEMATRRAALLGGNNWTNGAGNPQDAGRGSVRWRTLLENTLSRGGPRLYHKPAVNIEGKVQHRVMLTRIFDGDKEVLAAEYMPLVQQLGMADAWDRQLMTRIAALSELWPEETLVIPLTMSSLLQRPFVLWLQNMLLQCPKGQRKRFLFELAEADVCQHINRLTPVFRALKAFGCRVAVNQAGLTVVSSAYIRQLPLELIKLDAGLVRNIERRTENQLFVQSLLEVCKSTGIQVFATGVRTRSEWQTLVSLGIAGGQGDFFAPSLPVNSNVKKYSQRYRI
ncbi:RNase E specificity factor CsrD [Pantoea anthophila]|uniref:RNase E specificity factor CsrD n=1 Tax=Pantoea anthophila TaxID=470931 RepID=A0ABY2Z3V3_9GAMM|nr:MULTISPECIES: RNase E specificity factor CsrD [Pantoea]TPE14326.1 RNase E specificity factor CsrD [Pantoea vagans]KAF6660040.1 RNase E specificity factor CsrD [Pantoea sp. EKM101V]MEB5707684.1 RNase E specificity factor CsrD [Pantoea anthophila]MEB6518555.1 RNase E specificity factor CsrD [Pantoea anthophila]MEB7539570.1 RNase E specificity factor CsrD [Pantoea anthophila]